MKYKMRELKATDLPKMIRIVSKLDVDQVGDVIKTAGVSNIVKLAKVLDKKKQPAESDLVKNTMGDASALEAEGVSNAKEAPDEAEMNGHLALIGMSVAGKLITTILTAAADLQHDFNGLLADVTGLSVMEINEMNLGDYSELMMDFFEKPEFLVFFKQALRLFKKVR